jgi:hypothetical protein
MDKVLLSAKGDTNPAFLLGQPSISVEPDIEDLIRPMM